MDEFTNLSLLFWLDIVCPVVDELISVMCYLRDAPDAVEGAWLGVCDPWLLFCLYIPGAKVGIECVEPAVGLLSIHTLC